MTVAEKSGRVRLLGGEVDLITPSDVMDAVTQATTRGPPLLVANHNFHSLFLVRYSPALARFFEAADLIQIDSVPMIAWGRLLGLPVRRAMRSTYLDWRDDFWALADRHGNGKMRAHRGHYIRRSSSRSSRSK